MVTCGMTNILIVSYIPTIFIMGIDLEDVILALFTELKVTKNTMIIRAIVQ